MQTMMVRCCSIGLLLVALAPAQRQVQVTAGSIRLRTDVEGAPDLNPYFDQMPSGPLIYPYTKRIAFTAATRDTEFRALTLENEYLRCTVLPEVGGHLYGCLDKISGKQMFYTNPDLRKGWVGTRGAWSAFGVELNFPVGHSWVSISPVDFAATEDADGSGSAWVANTDRITGMRWRVEFVLRPGAAILEQHVTLTNPTALRRRYYWWANAAVRVEDPRTSFVYPTLLMAPHDFSEVFSWPQPKPGLDLTEVGKYTDAASYFTHGCREPFMAAYHPATRAGVVHYADVKEVPGKKMWTWGPDDYPRKELSRDNSTYIEIQGGLFENQETFEYLEPQQSRRFTEYWMPVREMSGITRAELAGTLYARRAADGSLAIEFLANRAEAGARLRVSGAGRTLLEEEVTLDPERLVRRSVSAAGEAPFAIRLTAASGRVLLEHTEDSLNSLTAGEYPPGPQTLPDWRTRPETAADYLKLGSLLESLWRPEQAESTYRTGVEKFDESSELWKAAGRLSLLLTRPEEAIARLSRAGGDAESSYYLGIAQELLGDDGKAKEALEAAAADPQWKLPASVALAYLESRWGNPQRALELLAADHEATTGLRIGLLRRMDRTNDAWDVLYGARIADPSYSLLRFEEILLGGEDESLWRHLAAEPERVLDLVDHYLKLGGWEEARRLLERTYPEVNEQEAEPKALRPQQHPLILYYRGYAKEKTGGSGAEDYARASRAALEYIFPNRPSSVAVLQAAIRQNAADATAHYLLGYLWLHFRKTDDAIAAWQTARQLNPGLPALHRNLGRALLDLKRDARAALPVLQEGITREPSNQDLQNALSRARAAQP